jgi:hypothetical protein
LVLAVTSAVDFYSRLHAESDSDVSNARSALQ